MTYHQLVLSAALLFLALGLLRRGLDHASLCRYSSEHAVDLEYIEYMEAELGLDMSFDKGAAAAARAGCVLEGGWDALGLVMVSAAWCAPPLTSSPSPLASRPRLHAPALPHLAGCSSTRCRC